jgi:tetratricopeptide (TPR) repeat protein
LPLLALLACAPDNSKARMELGAISRDLGQRNLYSAISRCDVFLGNAPQGQGSAEALYLRGRAYEERKARNLQEAKANLAAARLSYERALGLTPAGLLEAYVRTSLANVAFHQEDFATAASEWTLAYSALDRQDLKSLVMLRIGVCQQRLGRFADADRTLYAVQRQHPNSEAARLANQRQGLRTFWVQLAVFKTAAGADRAIAALQGERVIRTRDSQNRHVLRLGPYSTYADARAVRQKHAPIYPDAYVVP